MKALTISQPFASLISRGVKVVENRKWYTGYRGPLAIHAGKGTQYLDRDELKDYPTGCVVGVAELIGCTTRESIRMSAASRPDSMVGPYSMAFLNSHEHAEGPFCWILSDFRKFENPPAWKGAQGLWEIDLSKYGFGEPVAK